jgi:hypothetical protein
MIYEGDLDPLLREDVTGKKLIATKDMVYRDKGGRYLVPHVIKIRIHNIIKKTNKPAIHSDYWLLIFNSGLGNRI